MDNLTDHDDAAPDCWDRLDALMDNVYFWTPRLALAAVAGWALFF